MGVDEVGRGCIAGPVTVGLFAFRVEGLETLLADVGEVPVRDSKHLSEKKRARLYDRLEELAGSRKEVW